MANYELSVWTGEDKKLAVISADTITSNARAVNCQFQSKIDGTHTLTFDLYRQYFDEDTGSFIDNPFIDLLLNERILKLNYNDKWYDFVIKEINESHSDYKFSYSAQDLYLNELAKTGYSIEFDIELGNNTGTAEELAAATLTTKAVNGWSVDTDNSDVLLESTTEGVYRYELPRDITATQVVTDESDIDTEVDIRPTITLAAGTIVYFCYTDFANTDKTQFQILYNENQIYNLDEDGVITNVKNYEFNASDCSLDEAVFDSARRGKRYTARTWGRYDPVTEQTVQYYTLGDKHYYGYTDVNYITNINVTEFASNGKDFETTNGWYTAGQGASVTFGTTDANIPTDTGAEWNLGNFYSYLKFTKGVYYNNAFNNLSEFFQDTGIVENQQFVVTVAPRTDSELTDDGATTFVPSVCYRDILTNEPGASIGVCEYLGIQDEAYCFKVTITTPLSYEELKNNYAKYGLYFTCAQDEYILKQVSFFKWIDYAEGYSTFVTSDGDEFSTADGQVFSVIGTGLGFLPLGLEGMYSNIDYFKKYYECNSDWSSKYKDADKIQYLTVGQDSVPTAYTSPSSWRNHEKNRSISIKQSNRFNIIQEICEKFECWARFDVEHDANGKFISKKVVFKEYVGDNNYIGFKYGLNLKNISRKVSSSNIVTKTYVPANSNSAALHDSCNISRALQNPNGTQYILNLDYYTNQGILDKETTQQDIATFNSKVKNETSAYQEYSDMYNDLNTAYDKARSSYKSYYYLLQQVESTMKDKNDELVSAYNKYTSIDDFLNQSLIINSEAYKMYRGASPNSVIVELVTSYIILKDNKQKYTSQVVYYLGLQTDYITKMNNLSDAMDTCLSNISELEDTFFGAYSHYISEGTWNSEDYIDDNLYYLDALEVARTSSKPEVSYTFDAIDLSGIKEYDYMKFNIGDKTFVEDTEFFGYKEDGTPYQEQVVISDKTISLDSPDEYKITIQNYKTQFEDLFQRVAASTQSLQLKEGTYSKAAASFSSSGGLTEEIYQDTINNSDVTITNPSNQNVVWDSDGITLKSPIVSNRLHISSTGITMSNDNGATWSNVITNDGLNGDVISIGQLDVDKVKIKSDSSPNFYWDQHGLNAYAPTSEGVYDHKKLVRFDKFGIYGVDATITGDIDPVWDDISTLKTSGLTKFGLTWDGFWIRDDANTVSITSSGFSLASTNGSVSISSDGSFSLTGGNDKSTVEISSNDGIVIKDADDNEVFYADTNGDLHLAGTISAKDGDIGGWTIGDNSLSKGDVGMSTGDNSDTASGSPVRFYAGSSTLSDAKFIVRADGSMKATDASLQGGITLTNNLSFGSGSYYINPNDYSMVLPALSTNSAGVIQLGSGLHMDDGGHLSITSASYGASLPSSATEGQIFFKI